MGDLRLSGGLLDEHVWDLKTRLQRLQLVNLHPRHVSLETVELEQQPHLTDRHEGVRMSQTAKIRAGNPPDCCLPCSCHWWVAGWAWCWSAPWSPAGPGRETHQPSRPADACVEFQNLSKLLSWLDFLWVFFLFWTTYTTYTTHVWLLRLALTCRRRFVHRS